MLGTKAETAFTDSSVAGATTYSYSVVAIDAAGNRSPPVSTTVMSPDETAPDITPPSTPAGFSALALGKPMRVELSWAASSADVGVTGYRVYRDGSALASTEGTTHTDSAVKRSKKYRYEVGALDAAGNESALSASVKVKTKKK